MKRHSAFLAGALVALALSAGVRAVPTEGVDDALITGDAMPRSLADYGFFVDEGADAPAHGVTPYRLNMALFSDGADKLRYIYVPEGETVATQGAGLLQFPVGSAIIKTFAFGEGDAQRKIETRVLLHRAEGWIALPYVWNEDQTEARLALAGTRTQVTTPWGEDISYRVPNKNQCKECHGLDGAVTPIGPKARNLSAEWLRAFLGSVPEGADTMPRREDRGSADVAAAARAYLDVNCAHCHRPQATASNSGLDLRWETRDPYSFGVEKRPVAAGRGSGGHAFDIAPGDPDSSILIYRMASSETGVAMPELGKASVDEEGVALVRRWIAQMDRP